MTWNSFVIYSKHYTDPKLVNANKTQQISVAIYLSYFKEKNNSAIAVQYLELFN